MKASTNGGNAASKPSKKSSPEANQNWHNHQLEGDGLLLQLFHHLWKKNKNFTSCPGARCPDTVVYEHNFPRGWYRYDPKHQEIVKLAGRCLDTSHICAAFSTPVQGTDIVAQYISTAEDEGGRRLTNVEFFTREDLQTFLNTRKEKPDGILQRFVPTKGKENSQIQAIWSPRVCMVQRRSNKHAINDRYVAPYARCVTFDGPSLYSEDKICAQKTQDRVKEICASFVEHFQSTDHKAITRMVLYFKLDPWDNIWLLWCGSLRVAPPKFQGNVRRMPLDLAPTFSTPGNAGLLANGDDQLNGLLEQPDRAHVGLSHDILFARSLAARSPKKKRDQSASPRKSPSPSEGTRLPEVRRSVTGESPLATLSASNSAQSPLSRAADGAVTRGFDPEGEVEAEAALDSAASPLLWGGTRAKREELQRKEDVVLAVMDDVLYGLVAHWQRRHPAAYVVQSPFEHVRAVLSVDEFDGLMACLGFYPAAPGALVLDQNSAGKDYYICRHLDCAVAQLEHRLRAAVRHCFATRAEGWPDVDMGSSADCSLPGMAYWLSSSPKHGSLRGPRLDGMLAQQWNGDAADRFVPLAGGKAPAADPVQKAKPRSRMQLPTV
eukprot:EG_transcript_4341